MRRPRPLVLAAQGAALAAVLGTTAFVHLDTTVTLTVDGQEREVRGFHQTVGDVLAAEGLEVGPHDVVAPGPDVMVDEGSEVVLRYGRPLELEVDGERRTVWTTARSVDAALAALGVRAENGAYVSASRSQRIDRDGLRLEVRNPRPVTLVVGGERRQVRSTAETVAELLREQDVRLRPRDHVSAPGRARIEQGSTVRVTRVENRKAVQRVELGNHTRYVRTDDLYEGQTEVAREGRDGIRRDVQKVTSHDGREVARTLLDRDVVREPVDRVVRVGTAERPAPEPEPTYEPERSSGSGSSSSGSSSSGSSSSGSSSSGSSSRSSSGGGSSSSAPSPSADGLDWAALAQCESGGDPSAVNPIGYYGLYQFSPSTWRSVGGSGMPHEASAAEQTARAQMLYERTGPSSWPTCGRYL